MSILPQGPQCSDADNIVWSITKNIQVKAVNDLKLLVNALDGWKCESTIKQKLLMKENLQLLDDSTTKLARTDSTWGIDAGALNR